jgi:hypothetical protein
MAGVPHAQRRPDAGPEPRLKAAGGLHDGRLDHRPLKDSREALQHAGKVPALGDG